MVNNPTGCCRKLPETNPSRKARCGSRPLLKGRQAARSGAACRRSHSAWAAASPAGLAPARYCSQSSKLPCIVGESGLSLHGPPVVGGRLFDLALVLQGLAQTEMRVGQFRRKLDSLSVFVDGRLVVPQRGVRQAQVDARLRSRRKPDRLLQRANRQVRAIGSD